MQRGSLYRSRKERMIAGVCGGLGKHLGIDPTLVRLFFIVLTFTNGLGVFLYLLLAILMPLPSAEEAELPPAPPFWENPEAIRLAGISLVAVGVITLISALDIVYFSWLNEEFLWPLLLIIGGVALMVRALRN
ncbi:MAG: PspC domain-containing protein [Chloroflexi bacterium]|nr:PspC domain-containing protein [Chloroflexota bacterium]